MPRMYDILRGKVVEEVTKPAEEIPKKVPDSPKGPGENPKIEQQDPESKKEKASYLEFPDILAKKALLEEKSRPLTFPKNILQLDFKKEKKPEDHALVSKKLISAVKQHGVDNQEKAQEIYEDAVEIINKLLLKIRTGEKLLEYMDQLHELLDNVFNQLVMGDNLLNNVYEEKKGEYYLPYHIVNVLILSSVLGLNMGFNKSRLSHVGLASIFYDLGIDSMRELTGQPRPLSREESDVVKTHVAKSLDIVNRVGIINEVVKETITMHHERVSGNGYARGISADDINPYAKILGLVDTYEAMTHSRPYREGLNSHKAVRSLIGPLKNDFDTNVMKVFINKMSVYPIGSIVRLDTGEMARVISVQPGSPLRPVVMIFRGANGESIKERTIIDLSRQDFPAIKDSV